MPASKVNYLVLYVGESQVFGTATKEIALSSPPPEGCELKNKRILYIAFEPDTQNLVAYTIPQEEIDNAELTEVKPKKKKEKDVEEVQG
jgi:hypothetical protein